MTMPTYDYVCENPDCKLTMAVEQKITDPRLTTCPECKHPTLKRLISGAGAFELRGQGWFKTGGY